MALEQAVQHFRTYTSGIKPFVGHTKEFTERGTDLRWPNTVISHQKMFYRLDFLSRLVNTLQQLILRQNTPGAQSVVLGGTPPLAILDLLHALTYGNAQRLTQLLRAVFFQLGNG